MLLYYLFTIYIKPYYYVTCTLRVVHNTSHKVDLKTEMKSGGRQKTGELQVIFSGLEINMDTVTAPQQNGGNGEGATAQHNGTRNEITM